MKGQGPVGAIRQAQNKAQYKENCLWTFSCLFFIQPDLLFFSLLLPNLTFQSSQLTSSGTPAAIARHTETIQTQFLVDLYNRTVAIQRTYPDSRKTAVARDTPPNPIGPNKPTFQPIPTSKELPSIIQLSLHSKRLSNSIVSRPTLTNQ